MPEEKPIIHKREGTGVVCSDVLDDAQEILGNTAIGVGKLDLADEQTPSSSIGISSDRTGYDSDKPRPDWANTIKGEVIQKPEPMPELVKEEAKTEEKTEAKENEQPELNNTGL